MTMVLKFVTKEGLRFPYTKQEEAEFYSRNANGPPEYRSGRRRQSQRAPGIREQPRPKAEKERSVLFAAQIYH
jgi:hypothetical protein